MSYNVQPPPASQLASNRHNHTNVSQLYNIMLSPLSLSPPPKRQHATTPLNPRQLLACTSDHTTCIRIESGGRVHFSRILICSNKAYREQGEVGDAAGVLFFLLSLCFYETACCKCGGVILFCLISGRTDLQVNTTKTVWPLTIAN